MPRGFKVVDWTDPSNDAKLLVSVLKHVEVSKHYGDIAKDFGEHVPAQTIQLRVSKIKRMVKDGKPAASAARPSVKSTTTSKKAKADGRKKAIISNSGEESMDEEINASLTPPKTPIANDKTLSGRVIKSRMSPRKNPKKNYKKIEDPFEDENVTDGNGDIMFPKQKWESEDSDPTDVEFGQERTVKVETTEETTEEAI